MGEPQNPATSPALELQEQAMQRVVDRNVAEAWSDEDQSKLDAWIDRSPAHLAAYWCAEDNWNRTGLLSALQTVRPPQVHRAERPWMFRIRRIVIAAGIAAIGAAGFFYYNKPVEQKFATTLGGRETLRLADGSQVELNTDTVLRVSTTSGQRTATLERGEAFFEIKHDKAHPFVINVGSRRIVDLGTEFSVRTDGDRVEVALLEGLARIDNIKASSERSVFLRPGDIAVATAQSVSVAKVAMPRLSNDLAWRRGVLVFDNVTLSDVAAEFNRYNQRKIVIGNSKVGELKIMGSFQVNDLASVTAMAREVFKLRVTEESNALVISR